MKKKVCIAAGIVVALICGTLYLCRETFPTPENLLRNDWGITLPHDATIEKYEESQDSWFGEKWVYSQITIAKNDDKLSDPSWGTFDRSIYMHRDFSERDKEFIKRILPQIHAPNVQTDILHAENLEYTHSVRYVENTNEVDSQLYIIFNPQTHTYYVLGEKS